MKMMCAMALVLLAGCATGPMTQEEQDSSDRTIRALQILNAGPWGTRQQAPAPQAQPVAFLKGSYVSGMNRICLYDRLGSTVAITIRSGDICPLSQ